MNVGNWGFPLNFYGLFFSACRVTAADKVNREGRKGTQMWVTSECVCVSSELAALYRRT